MKTITLEVEDTLHEHLMALIKQLPEEKVHIVQTEPEKTTFRQDEALAIHEQLMDQYTSAFERLAK